MAKVSQVFDHDSPSAPTLLRGMVLGASGVSAPPLHTIGSMTGGAPTADGNFNDPLGLGQFDTDTSGNLFVADRSNNRLQRCVENASGLFIPDSKCSASSALGANIVLDLVAIDRTRNQIHIGSSAQIASGTYLGVWDLALWPNLTVANRTRSYGTSSGSDGVGNLRVPLALTLIGDIAIVCSSTGDYRAIKYDHTTGAILAQITRALWYSRFASDGTKLYSGSQASNAELGLWLMNSSTLAGTTRLDTSTPSGGNYTRRNHLVQGGGGDITDVAYHEGRVYVRLLRDGRVMAWNTSSDTFADECLWPGGASASESFGHAPGLMLTSQVQQAKIGVAFAPNTSKCDKFIAWSGNAQNTTQHSFLTVWPMSIATATWTKTDWSVGTNTLQALNVIGAHVSGEKYKIRLRKNLESWITFNSDTLDSAAFFASVGTFTMGDMLTVELSLSTWERLDFYAGLSFTRDKLRPTDVHIELTYNDSLADQYVPYASGALKGRLGGTGAFRGKLGG